MYFYLSSNWILILEFVDIYTRKQDKNTNKEDHFLQCTSAEVVDLLK